MGFKNKNVLLQFCYMPFYNACNEHPNGTNPPNVQENNKELRELKQQQREKRKLQEKQNQLRRQLLEQEQQEQ